MIEVILLLHAKINILDPLCDYRAKEVVFFFFFLPPPPKYLHTNQFEYSHKYPQDISLTEGENELTILMCF